MIVFKNRFLFLFFTAFFLFGFVFPPNYLLASTTSEDQITRISGLNRYQTAIKIAQTVSPGSVSSVIIASGLNFPDALSGSVLGVKNDAPILLVGKTISDSQDTLDYINNNLDKSGTVYILGGTSVIPTDFETKLAELGIENVIRLEGTDRYESSARIAQELKVPKGTPITIVFGGNFPDALGMSSFAANKGWPILLSRTNELPESMKELISENAPGYIYIAGGTGVITDSVKQEIQELAPHAVIERFAGNNRFETSSLINNYFAPYPAHVYLTSGMNYPDALTGSILAGKNGDPIVLIDPGSRYIPEETEKYLKIKLNLNSYDITSLGGTSVVPDNLVSQSLYGADRKPVFIPSSVSSHGFKIASFTATNTNAATLSFSATVPVDTVTVLLVIQKDGKEEIIRAKAVNGKVQKNIYPRLGPGNYQITVYDANGASGKIKETFNIFYSGTDGMYDKTVNDSIFEMDIPSYEEVHWAWINIVKVDGETAGAMDDYTIPVYGRISHQFLLRFGPGKYVISVYEGETQYSFNPGPSFTVTNTDVREVTYTGPSYWVQSDVPEVISLAQQITKGLSNDSEKSKAIHDWVATHLTYVQGYGVGNSSNTLRTGEADSAGYAQLTAALHRASGIQAKVIDGYTIGFTPTDPQTWDDLEQMGYNKPVRYWNEILINGQWVTADALWDSGTVDANGVFSPNYSAKYFNIDDETFSINHRKLILPEGVKTIPW